jgi:hypothetical protein
MDIKLSVRLAFEDLDGAEPKTKVLVDRGSGMMELGEITADMVVDDSIEVFRSIVPEGLSLQLDITIAEDSEPMIILRITNGVEKKEFGRIIGDQVLEMYDTIQTGIIQCLVEKLMADGGNLDG